MVAVSPATVAILSDQIGRVMDRVRRGLGLPAAVVPPDTPLFPGRWGGHRTARSLTLAVSRERKRAGIGRIEVNGRSRHAVWLHGLRHTVATELRAAGTDPLVVADRLGHTSVAMTDAYTSVPSASSRAAAELISARLLEAVGSEPAD